MIDFVGDNRLLSTRFKFSRLTPVFRHQAT
jgi:hypothetical protein